MDRSVRLAVLIYADNARASLVKELLEDVARYGTATLERGGVPLASSNGALEPLLGFDDRETRA